MLRIWLRSFVVSDKKTQVLPYVPENRRKFVKEVRGVR